MNEENKKKLWKLIQKTGDELKGKLPEHPSHPKGRNPYAHIALEIKNHFGMSYNEISDERIPELEKFIFYKFFKFRYLIVCNITIRHTVTVLNL